jgi:hypothetical protein
MPARIYGAICKEAACHGRRCCTWVCINPAAGAGSSRPQPCALCPGPSDSLAGARYLLMDSGMQPAVSTAGRSTAQMCTSPTYLPQIVPVMCRQSFIGKQADSEALTGFRRALRYCRGLQWRRANG